jgi:AraC-like DNA-binding protein
MKRGAIREVDPTLQLPGDIPAPPASGHRVTLCPTTLQPVLRRIESELDRPLRVSDMAGAVGLSVFHFSREFRRVTGISPYAYIRRRRIARAALLLAGSKLPIVEIAHVVGFKTHAHFSGAFLKTMGATPRAYRLRYGPRAHAAAPGDDLDETSRPAAG